MRERAAVVADPQASQDELVRLAREDVLAALAHPNCPADLWWELAASYPIEAQDSVLFEMMTLENPTRWVELETELIGPWIGFACMHLSESQEHLFAADCAEHVLHFFERRYPGDPRPREAIRVRRLFVKEIVNSDQWEAASEAANEAASECASAEACDAARSTAWGAADSAANSASCAVARWASSTADWNAARLVEWKWQWARVQQYLRGEVQ